MSGRSASACTISADDASGDGMVLHDEALGRGTVPRNKAVGDDALGWLRATRAACEGAAVDACLDDDEADDAGPSTYPTSSRPRRAAEVILAAASM